jgi:hypothetical protein
MRTSLVVLLVILFVKSGYSQRRGHEISTTDKKFAQDTIIWQNDSILTADDFKSKTKKKDQAAYTCSAIFFHTDGYDPSVFFVEAIFLKSKSYIKENVPYLLKHESLHFDITELYARQLRQALHETDFTKVKNISSEINKLYTKASQDAEREQERYDKDTEHGLNAAKQQLWNEDIAKRLAAANEFSSTKISIVK